MFQRKNLLFLVQAGRKRFKKLENLLQSNSFYSSYNMEYGKWIHNTVEFNLFSTSMFSVKEYFYAFAILHKTTRNSSVHINI